MIKRFITMLVVVLGMTSIKVSAQEYATYLFEDHPESLRLNIYKYQDKYKFVTAKVMEDKAAQAKCKNEFVNIYNFKEGTEGYKNRGIRSGMDDFMATLESLLYFMAKYNEVDAENFQGAVALAENTRKTLETTVRNQYANYYYSVHYTEAKYKREKNVIKLAMIKQERWHEHLANMMVALDYVEYYLFKLEERIKAAAEEILAY